MLAFGQYREERRNNGSINNLRLSADLPEYVLKVLTISAAQTAQRLLCKLGGP